MRKHISKGKNRTALNRKNKSKIRNSRNTRNTRNKSIKMKGGSFSDVFSLWDTMTYNLSNAVSTFSITPPTATGNFPQLVNPSVSKQFLQVK